MGEVVWFMKHECSSLAVGAKCFYVLHVHGNVGGFYGLETLDLENVVSRARSMAVAPYRAANSFCDLRMVLSADEALIAVKLKNELLCIFETSSGQLMHIEEPEPLGYDASDACWVYSTAKQSEFMEVCWKQGRVSIIYLTKRRPLSTGNIRRTKVMSFAEDSLAPRGGLDIHRNLTFEERIDRHGVCLFLVKPLKTEPKKQTYSETLTI